MFEVGKKYRRIGTVVNGFECVFSQKAVSERTSHPVGIAVLKDIINNVLFGVDEDNWSNWEEVIEPRVEYFNAYKYDGGRVEYGSPYETEELTRVVSKNHKDFYGILKMTHYSDRVDVEFHLKRK